MARRATVFELCDIVRETAFAIHQCLKHGQLEKVYENALAHRLRKFGLPVAHQVPRPVGDKDGTPLGDFYCDLLVENCLIVEVKAIRSVGDDAIAQLLGYLRSSRREHGLIVNFGAKVFSIRKHVLRPAD